MFTYKLKNISLLFVSIIKFIFFVITTFTLIPIILFGIIKLWNEYNFIDLYETNIIKILTILVSIMGDSTVSKMVSMIIFLICVIISLVFIFIMVLYIISMIWHGDCVLFSYVIDTKNSMLYYYETIFNKEHKEVRSGNDWLKAKFAKKTQNKKKDRWDETYNQYNQDYQYQEKSHYSSSSNNYKPFNDSQAELQKAIGLFMLDDLYITTDELKHKRNVLIKKFHPDEGETEESYSKKINTSYDLLLKYIKKKP